MNQLIKYTTVLYISYLMTLISCNNSKNGSNAVILNPTDTLYFNTSNPIISYYTQYFKSSTGEKYLIFLNKEAQSLNFYNYANGINEITVPVGLEIGSYYVHTLDSIFILAKHSNTVLMINNTGKVIAGWNSSKADYNLLSYYPNPIFLLKNKILVGHFRKTYSPLSSNQQTLDTFFNATTGTIINLSKGQNTETEVGNWPDEYRSGKEYYELNPCWTVNGNNDIIISFSILNTIQVYNPPYNTYHTFMAESRYTQSISTFPFDSFFNYKYINKYVSSEFKYDRIIYDKYRNLYYRIVCHKQEYENKNGTVNLWRDKPWSVIVLDSNFKLLDEIKFPSKTYEIGSIIPTSDGLLISANHEANSLYKPNRLTFILFQIHVKRS